MAGVRAARALLHAPKHLHAQTASPIDTTFIANITNYKAAPHLEKDVVLRQKNPGNKNTR